MLAISRQNLIKELLQENKSVTIADLAVRMNVTRETIRRDLRAMEQEHELIRTHGGAYILDGVQNDLDISTRQVLKTEEKGTDIAPEELNRLAAEKEQETETRLNCLEEEIRENSRMLGERKQLREETGTLEKTLRELENERNGLAVEKAGLEAEQKQDENRIRNLRNQTGETGEEELRKRKEVWTAEREALLRAAQETGAALEKLEKEERALRAGIDALEKQMPVTDKYVSVVAEVSRPVTVRVPIGCTLDEVVEQAGEITTKDAVYFVGGPMMGRIGSGSDPGNKDNECDSGPSEGSSDRYEEAENFFHRFKTCSVYLLPV